MVRGRRTVLLITASVVALAGTGLTVAANVATGGSAEWFPPIDRHPLWWVAGTTLVVAASGLFLWQVQRAYERGLSMRIPVAQRPESWMVDRPVEVTQIVRALRRRRGTATVGITTAVHGAGGFGKTTVARLVRSDRRILRRFRGGVYWVTLGRDIHRGGLVKEVNDLIFRIDPARAKTFDDARQAAEHLAAVLAEGPRRLVILDDVWSEDQLAAFPTAGRCARLVTTRIQSTVADRGIPVKVDQMSFAQAREVLTADLHPLPPPAIVEKLLVETGRWPLLLRLVNKVMVDQMRSQTDVSDVAQSLLRRLHSRGVLKVVNHLTDSASLQLDIDDPEQRSQAVGATIEASAGLLRGDRYIRFAELAVFAEDETIPLSLVILLWQQTGSVDDAAGRALCAQLDDLALVTVTATDDGGTITLHDVLRDYLRDQLGGSTITRLHQTLLDAAGAGLLGHRAGDNTVDQNGVAWWQLPDSARYLREHLIEHLLGADRAADAEAVATDLRWVCARLEEGGPIGPANDLARIGTPRANHLGRLLGQISHLLAATDPPYSVIDILHNCVAQDAEWSPQVHSLAALRERPALVGAWTVANGTDPALLRTLTGIAVGVPALAVSPDGTWLATPGQGGVLQIWDSSTGALRATLMSGGFAMHALAVSPDGSWLAGAGNDETVRLWEVAAGASQRHLRTGQNVVEALAFSPNGDWLATAGQEGEVRIWDTRTWALLAQVYNGRGPLWSLAVSPDGTWMATGDGAGIVRICDTASGDLLHQYRIRDSPVWSLTISPDGTWLATADDGVVTIRNMTTGAVKQLPPRGDGARSVAFAADGSWLAVGDIEGRVRIVDPVSGTVRKRLSGHRLSVEAMVLSPDGNWLATADQEGRARIWDVTFDGLERQPTSELNPVQAVAISPTGGWFATAGDDRTVYTRGMATGRRVSRLPGHIGEVLALAICPDDSTLASGDSDGVVRVWDGRSGDLQSELTVSETPVRTLAIAPSARRIVSGDADGVVRFWDADNKKTAVIGHKGAVRTVAISPDGDRVATAGDDRRIRIWDVVQDLRRPLTVGRKLVRSMTFSLDGALLATADTDGFIEIWLVATGALQTQLACGRQLQSVAFSTDGRWLASVERDGVARVWQTNGTCVAMMRVEASLLTCAWDPRGTALVVGGIGGLYRFDFHTGLMGRAGARPDSV
ncbi:NB-ARC domain-containing protein [Kribbella sp. C-35]|uniref:NB-ARC domain-containing protein n=1 Tax=Kribbella sp. C-35 TaxID=2789276 RepID=UPI00397882B2